MNRQPACQIFIQHEDAVLAHHQDGLGFLVLLFNLYQVAFELIDIFYTVVTFDKYLTILLQIRYHIPKVGQFIVTFTFCVLTDYAIQCNLANILV